MLKTRENPQNIHKLYPMPIGIQKRKGFECSGTCCMNEYSHEVYDRFLELMEKESLPCSVKRKGEQ